MVQIYNPTQVEARIIEIAYETRVSNTVIELARKIVGRIPEKGNRPKSTVTAAGAVWLAYVLSSGPEAFPLDKPWPISMRSVQSAAGISESAIRKSYQWLAEKVLGLNLDSVNWTDQWRGSNRTAYIRAIQTAFQNAGGVDALLPSKTAPA